MGTLFERAIDITALTHSLQELNIRTVTITAEEDKYGVKYKLIPDWKTLGGKLKKDLPKVKNGVPNVSQEDIKKYVQTNEIQINGVKLGEGDLQVTRYFDDENSSYHANATNDVLVILDVALDQGLINEGMAREFINRVQRLRKEVMERLLQTPMGLLTLSLRHRLGCSLPTRSCITTR